MLMHSRREKHAGISKNGQQNMAIIGIKLEEVFSFKTRKDLKGVRWGYPVRWRYPYARVKMVATIVWSSHTTHDQICLFSCFGFGSLQEVIDDTWREMFSNVDVSMRNVNISV